MVTKIEELYSELHMIVENHDLRLEDVACSTGVKRSILNAFLRKKAHPTLDRNGDVLDRLQNFIQLIKSGEVAPELLVTRRYTRRAVAQPQNPDPIKSEKNELTSRTEKDATPNTSQDGAGAQRSQKSIKITTSEKLQRRRQRDPTDDMDPNVEGKRICRSETRWLSSPPSLSAPLLIQTTPDFVDEEELMNNVSLCEAGSPPVGREHHQWEPNHPMTLRDLVTRRDLLEKMPKSVKATSKRLETLLSRPIVSLCAEHQAHRRKFDPICRLARAMETMRVASGETKKLNVDNCPDVEIHHGNAEESDLEKAKHSADAGYTPILFQREGEGDIARDTPSTRSAETLPSLGLDFDESKEDGLDEKATKSAKIPQNEMGREEQQLSESRRNLRRPSPAVEAAVTAKKGKSKEWREGDLQLRRRLIGTLVHN
eukprot:GHVN01021559.1.p1 GENE.GHVN01021559.1~~GHVN01021559.1.p1  ORF type:complete len:428 (+),score=52.85 GHVN01021559.1:163-1446(+)